MSAQPAGLVLGWHFLSPSGTAYGGYRPSDIGVWEPAIENPSPCMRGYHGSPTILKALEYAQGPILGRCEYRGVVSHPDGGKWAARERRCIARVDASAWLRFAAAHFAEEAVVRAGMTDERSLEVIRVARRFALGQATQAELAARVGTSQANISKLEHGTLNPSFEMAQRIAAGLGKRLAVSIQ